MKKIERYDLFEIEIKDVEDAGLVEYCAEFTNGDVKKMIPAFRSTAGIYKVRFMPEQTGIWKYRIVLGGREQTGEFECADQTGANHGPVVTEGYHFRYQDGEKYIPFGTTCYAWIHQTEELQEQTLASLKDAPFNKIRMCVFPKSMPYNNNDPDCYPFFKRADGSWDVNAPDPAFWNKLDKRIEALIDLGIEADLILFHPYDRWRFALMSQEDSLTYLEYCIARLSAYRNIWWSLANEYEMLYEKNYEDWDSYGEMLQNKDPYGHLISVHNILGPYPKREWMTHCSIQSADINSVVKWKKEYQIPVIIDECGYEGNIEFDWGNLSAFEMTHRFWWTFFRGGYCTHGETFHREDEVLWWAKGGKLYGESPKRIAFLKELMYSLPGGWDAVVQEFGNPNVDKTDEAAVKQEERFMSLINSLPEHVRENMMVNTPMLIEGENFQLRYYAHTCPSLVSLDLKEDKKYRIEIIDIWEMTRKLAAEGVSGKIRIGMPGKEGIVAVVTCLDK